MTISTDLSPPLQVIEDTVSVVQHVRQERHVPVSVPNIVIGGSYGESFVMPTAAGCGVQLCMVYTEYVCMVYTEYVCHKWTKQMWLLGALRIAAAVCRCSLHCHHSPPTQRQAPNNTCTSWFATDPHALLLGTGGMIASYHRVVRPDVVDAAVAASAPIYYIGACGSCRRSAGNQRAGSGCTTTCAVG